MKIRSLFTCCVLVLSLIFVAAANVGYVIKGKIVGLTTGKVTLSHTYGNKTIVDTANVNDGNFIFKGNTPEPLLYKLSVVGIKNQTFTFLVENANMNIEAKKDSLFKAKAAGSEINNLYNSFYQVDWKPITAKAGVIYGKLDQANQGGKVKLDSATRKRFDDEFAQLEVLNDSVIVAYVKRNKNSVAAAIVIQDRYITYPYAEKARKLFPVLSSAVQNSYYGKQVKEVLDLEAKLGIGRIAPNFLQKDTSGKVVQLKDFKGKYVLVDFWASWCVPCRAENPNVVKVYKKYHAKGFEIIGVSLDDKKDAWLNAIHADGLTWNHLSDLKGWANAVALDYGVKSVPASYLLDREGKIVAKGLKGDALDKKLAELLK